MMRFLFGLSCGIFGSYLFHNQNLMSTDALPLGGNLILLAVCVTAVLATAEGAEQ